MLLHNYNNSQVIILDCAVKTFKKYEDKKFHLPSFYKYNYKQNEEKI